MKHSRLQFRFNNLGWVGCGRSMAARITNQTRINHLLVYVYLLFFHGAETETNANDSRSDMGGQGVEWSEQNTEDCTVLEVGCNTMKTTSNRIIILILNELWNCGFDDCVDVNARAFALPSHALHIVV